MSGSIIRIEKKVKQRSKDRQEFSQDRVEGEEVIKTRHDSIGFEKHEMESSLSMLLLYTEQMFI
jgi:hypothetical protein